MSLESIVNISISRQTASISQAGFGIPLILAASTVISAVERARVYSSMTAVAVDFTAGTDEYKMATAIFSQSPKPSSIVIGRHDQSGDETITEALDAIQLVNSDWYCLLLASRDADDIEEAAAWIEARKKIFLAVSGDAGVKAAGSSDVASTLMDAGNVRTAVFYTATATKQIAAAIAGLCLPLAPGSETWMFKQASGVAAESLTDTEKTHLDDKNVNYQSEVAGLSILMNGKVAGGDFIDTIRGIDWLQSRMQENVFSKLANSNKVPFSDGGIAIIEGAMREVLMSGVRVGLIRDEQSFTVTVPKVADVSSNDRAARTLTGVSFTAILAGAVHGLTITGTVTV